MLPIQPIVADAIGTIRFRPNRLVEHLLQDGPFDMNHLAVWSQTHGIPDEEQAQFAQLIGYSVSGFADLSYVDDNLYARVDISAADTHELADLPAGVREDAIAMAHREYANDEISIDPDSKISKGDDGYWVQAWVWVHKEDQ